MKDWKISKLYLFLSFLMPSILVSGDILQPTNSKTYRFETGYRPLFIEFEQPRELSHLSNVRSFTEIPEAGFYRAFQKMKEQTEYDVKANGTDPWKSIGPFNLGGRMLGLAVDPNNPDCIWAGSATGGLWKLTFTGEGAWDYQWKRIETDEPILGVRSIAVDPEDSDIIYVGTGEAHFHRDFQIRLLRTMYTYGIGLLKTTDGGASWTKSIDWSYQQSRGVQSIKINPKNPDIIYAGTTEGTYRSKTAGAGWKAVHDVLMAMDIDINPEDPDTLFISCGNAGSEGTGIYRSFDGGDTWEKCTNGLPPSWTGKALLDIYHANPEIIFADISNLSDYIGLYKSENNGDTWSLVTQTHMGNFMGMYAHYIRVNPEDSSKLFKTEIHYGYSEDNGNTWEIKDYIDDEYAWKVDTTCMHVDHHVFANDPTDPNTFYAGNDGGIYRTRDGGKTFQDLNRGLVTTQFYPGFASSDTDTAFAMGGMQDNGSSIYNGSPDWTNWVLGGDGSEAAINPLNNDIVYLSFYKLMLFRSMNRGEDLEFIGPVNFFPDWYQGSGRDRKQDEVAKMAPFVLLDNNQMYAATNYVYKSYDGGDTWFPCNSDRAVTEQPIMAITVSKINTDVVYISARPNLLTGIPPQVKVSKDGGNSWNDITGNLPNRDIIVQVAPHSPGIVYAVIGGFGTSHLFRSYDFGSTWSDIGEGLPDIPTNAVAIDPEYPQNIYVGNDLGVWVSIDNGQSWEPLKSGMPTASIVLDFNILENYRKIRAVTHGNGIYEKSLVPPDDNYIDSFEEKPFSLSGNVSCYPNPFVDHTYLTIHLIQPSTISIRIFNNTGQVVQVFPELELPGGKHEIVWDGRNIQGDPCPAGTYFVRIMTDNDSHAFTLLRIN